MSATQTTTEKAELFKIAVVGSGGVGKSAITLRFVNNTFVDYYDPTIEDSYSKQVLVDGKTVKLEILDTAGQEYEILRDSYMRNNDGFILVYSMVDRSSFEELEKKFMNHIVQCKDGSMDVPMVLVGNKCDLESSRQVQKSVGRDMAKKWNIPFLELSAKQGTNVQECFQAIVRQLREMNEEEDGQPKKDTTDGQKKCLIM
ncbi:ras family small GTPase [Naegleria gruberi]|uniref:small monomeric GTPase n=1 Tax=Naegleria gruberi TaxID=5762 RepID=D2V142_NAEGR|nr:ras family small GTPase [Naegleria gruberi]EFC49626.1 ras family small GTPase [Naegleria gruberi]|eukprot:XP_002682370.1 ras family small GTPase [Naegleria gruberi strain NEG-M]